MKAKECIEKPRTGKWIKRMALAAAAFIMFSYLYSRGISPVWAAVAIVCFQGISSGFLYKIACLSGSGGDTFFLHPQLPGISDSTGIQYREMKTNAAYKPLQHLAGQGCPNGRLFLVSHTFMKTRMTGSGTERKERHIQPLADRELQGKVGNASFRTARPGPFGFRGKIILARRACGIFPESLAFPEASAVKPM